MARNRRPLPINQLWDPVPSRFQMHTVFPFSFLLFLLKADSQWDIKKAGCSKQLYPLRHCLCSPRWLRAGARPGVALGNNSQPFATVCGAGSSPGHRSPEVCSSLSLAAPGISSPQMAFSAPALGRLGGSVHPHPLQKSASGHVVPSGGCATPWLSQGPAFKRVLLEVS